MSDDKGGAASAAFLFYGRVSTKGYDLGHNFRRDERRVCPLPGEVGLVTHLGFSLNHSM